jgi:hypothetical protein
MRDELERGALATKVMRVSIYLLAKY